MVQELKVGILDKVKGRLWSVQMPWTTSQNIGENEHCMWGYGSECPRKPHYEELVASLVCEDSGNCREGKVLLRIYNFWGLWLPFPLNSKYF
jgi:hypothetical protein